MKKTKKISLFAISMIMASSVCAYADIPSKTVVIGEKAYDLNYANNKENLKEILQVMKDNQKENIYIKLADGKWYDNKTKGITEKALVPPVSYKNSEGKVKVYEAEDGENVTFQAESAYFVSGNEVAVRFSLPSNVDTLKKLIKIDGKSLKEGDQISLSEDGQTVLIKLADEIKKDNFKTSIEIEKGAADNYGDKIEEGFKREILVVNDSTKELPSSVNSDVNILCSDKTFKNIKIDGNLFVAGDNLTLEGMEIRDNLVFNSGEKSKVSFINSKSNKINIYSGAEITLDGSEINDVNVSSSIDTVIKSINGNKIQNVKINSREAVVTLDGTFDNVISGYKVKEVKLAPNAQIKKLTLKSKTSINGDKTNKIGEIASAREEFKKDITEDIEENVEIKDDNSNNKDKEDEVDININNKIYKRYENEALTLIVKGDKKAHNKASLEFRINLKNDVTSTDDMTIAMYDSNENIIYIGQGDIADKEYSFNALVERGNNDIYLRIPGQDNKIKINMKW